MTDEDENVNSKETTRTVEMKAEDEIVAQIMIDVAPTENDQQPSAAGGQELDENTVKLMAGEHRRCQVYGRRNSHGNS